jgi:hypothetical protein
LHTLLEEKYPERRTQAMMHMMTAIPPIPTTMTSSDVLFWGMIGLLVALFLLATTLWVIGSRRIAQRQYEASPRFQYDEQPVVHYPQEETLLRR